MKEYYLWYEKRIGKPIKRFISEDTDLDFLKSEVDRLNAEHAPNVFWVENCFGLNVYPEIKP